MTKSRVPALAMALAGLSYAGSSIPGLLFEDVFVDSFERATIAPYWEAGTVEGAGYPPWGIDSTSYHSPRRSAADSPNGEKYPNNSVRYMAMHMGFDLRGMVSARASYWTRYTTQVGNDVCYVEVSINGGATWQIVDSYSGSSGWILKNVSLDNFVGNQDVRLRFVLDSDKGNNKDGWYVDDVVVSAQTAPVHDVGAVQILAPVGSIPLAESVTPIALYANLGSQTDTTKVHFRILQGADIKYWDSTRVVLAVGGCSTVTFRKWYASPAGDYQTKAWTWMSSDLNHQNDSAYNTFHIEPGFRDVSLDRIEAPATLLPPGFVAPVAWLRNRGTSDEPIACRCWIIQGSDTVYYAAFDTTAVTHGDSIRVRFDDWLAMPSLSGYSVLFRVFCFPPDDAPVNDTVRGQFWVQPYSHDIGPIQVLTPPESCYADTLALSALFQNFGLSQENDFDAHYAVYDNQQNLVLDSSARIPVLAPGYSTVVQFGKWFAPAGYYAVKCYSALASDQHRSNDTIVRSLKVMSTGGGGGGGGGGGRGLGWIPRADLPIGGRAKRVKDGADLATIDGVDLFTLKGNNTTEFYQYNTTANAWTTRESIPLYGRLGRKKTVKKGGTLTPVSGALYATKGNNTLEFWQYNPSTRIWTQKADVLAGTKKVKDGASAAAVPLGGVDHLFLLRASNTPDLCYYQPYSDLWLPLPAAPLGRSGKAFKAGSCVAYDPDDRWLYVLKGTYNEFYRYDVGGRTWTTMESLPFIGTVGNKKKVKDGAAMVYRDRYIYALKGGNTNEFWTYLCDSNKWRPSHDVPIALLNKKVKGGGALVYASGPDMLYATKGNNTLEFYAYVFDTSSYYTLPSGGAAASAGRVPGPWLSVTPNPLTRAATIAYVLPEAGRVSLKLHDVAGRLVATLVSGHQTAGSHSYSLLPALCSLARGVYLLRFETETQTLTRKLVIE